MENGPGSARRLLGVFAHPDDEVFCAGGTMARAAEAGAEVMIVSATRGERGQIRDPAAATRRTLGAVREGELCAAAAELGVQHVQVLAYPDGTLQHHRSSLGAAIADIMRQFDPDTVITFGADGGYGHPDHVAISELTTARSGRWSATTTGGSGCTTPSSRRGAPAWPRNWRTGSPARGSVPPIAPRCRRSRCSPASRPPCGWPGTTYEWSGFPRASCVIEQGEPADALYLILNGTADALLEHPDGQVSPPAADAGR